MCSYSCPVEEERLKQGRRRRGLGGRQVRSRPSEPLGPLGRKLAQGGVSFGAPSPRPELRGRIGARCDAEHACVAIHALRCPPLPASQPRRLFCRAQLPHRAIISPRGQRAASKVIEPSASLGPVCAKSQRSLPRGPSSRCFAAFASRVARRVRRYGASGRGSRLPRLARCASAAAGAACGHAACLT